jgi:hypothetical protein
LIEDESYGSAELRRTKEKTDVSEGPAKLEIARSSDASINGEFRKATEPSSKSEFAPTGESPITVARPTDSEEIKRPEWPGSSERSNGTNPDRSWSDESVNSKELETPAVRSKSVDVISDESVKKADPEIRTV